MTRVPLALLLAPVLLSAQSLDPTDILKPLGASPNWSTYGGDYSGRRYSALEEIHRSNVKSLVQAWKTKLIAGAKDTGPNVSVSGVGQLEAGALANIKGSVLQVDGVLYIAAPDNAWALD